MKRTAFVADTTIGLSPSEAEARGIHLVPVQVIVDGVPFRDLFEFTPEALQQAQQGGKKISTSQVNPADLERLYSNLLERHDQVISVHMSSKLSGTYATAKLIAERLEDRVCPIDSRSLNAGLDYVLEGVRQAVNAGVPNHLLESSISPLRDRCAAWCCRSHWTVCCAADVSAGCNILLARSCDLCQCCCSRMAWSDRLIGPGDFRPPSSVVSKISDGCTHMALASPWPMPTTCLLWNACKPCCEKRA